jgi:hypothetical protein
MPRIFERDGYRFFFYNNEHRPIHVHVRYGDGEASNHESSYGSLKGLR